MTDDSRSRGETHHLLLRALHSLASATLPSAVASAATAMMMGGMPIIVHSFMSASRRRSETCVFSKDGDVMGSVRWM